MFADDWGRHPSSAQHLVRQLSPRLPTLWVNTIGTRRPTAGRADRRRILAKLGRWSPLARPQGDVPANVVVADPLMYPGFRTDWQRQLNTWQLAKTVQRHAARPGWSEDAMPRYPRMIPRRIGVTTLPITAGLVAHSRRLGIDRWVYYCVDNLAAWPGLDGQVMASMEFGLALDADVVVCASEHLRQRLVSMGRDDARLLTHGIDLGHWSAARSAGTDVRDVLGQVLPTYLFFGLIDARLDMTWCLALGSQQRGAVWLVGPSQPGTGAQGWLMADQLRFTGAVPFEQLPGVAMRAKVLVMPYADAVVTRAMQPLKLMEYLAAGWPDAMRPVVVRDLPATRAWADCCDLAGTAEEFVRLCRERAATGLPAGQREARLRRLPAEAWSHKAATFESMITRPIARRGDVARHVTGTRSIRPRVAA